MELCLFTLLLLFILDFSVVTYTHTIHDTNDLLTELFTSSKYNKKVRPIEDQTIQLVVTISFYISGKVYFFIFVFQLSYFKMSEQILLI